MTHAWSHHSWWSPCSHCPSSCPSTNTATLHSHGWDDTESKRLWNGGLNNWSGQNARTGFQGKNKTFKSILIYNLIILLMTLIWLSTVTASVTMITIPPHTPSAGGHLLTAVAVAILSRRSCFSVRGQNYWSDWRTEDRRFHMIYFTHLFFSITAFTFGFCCWVSDIMEPRRPPERMACLQKKACEIRQTTSCHWAGLVLPPASGCFGWTCRCYLLGKNTENLLVELA